MKKLLQKIIDILNYEVIDGEKEISPYWATGIIVVFIGGLIVLGTYLGERFFWDRPIGVTRIERDFNQAVKEVNEAPDSASARLKLGWVFYQQGNLEAAEKHYREALLIDKNSFGAQLNLGIIKFDQGKYEEAINFLQKAMEIRPKYEISYFYLGTAHYYLKKYEEALKYLKIAIKLEPASADNHYYFALTQEMLGQIEDAKEHLEITLTFDPQYEDARKALDRIGVRGEEGKNEN